MSNKKCDLPKGSHRTAFKVPAPPLPDAVLCILPCFSRFMAGVQTTA